MLRTRKDQYPSSNNEGEKDRILPSSAFLFYSGPQQIGCSTILRREIGFTDEEMFELYQREADESGVDIRLPSALAIAMGTEYAYTAFPGKIVLYAEPQDGDVKYDSFDIDFEAIAKACGWVGKGSAVAFIVSQVTKDAFIKAIVNSTGLGWVSAITTLAGGLFDWLMTHTDSTGCTITVKYVYQYDPYEGFGKWYMVNADYVLW